MPINGKTADQMREEFYEALRRERAEREAKTRELDESYRRERAEREAKTRELDESYRRERAEREESQRLFKERMEESRRLFEERMEQSRRLFEERLEQSRKEKDEEWKRITGEWGRFTNDEGGMVEYEGVAALRDLPEIGGMPIDEVVSSLKLTKKGREYDGYIQCPKAVVLLEFKRRLTRASVRKFLDEQLSGFPRDFPGMLQRRAYYGAVAGATIDADAEALARENGLFVIRIPANRRVEVLNDKAKTLPA